MSDSGVQRVEESESYQLEQFLGGNLRRTILFLALPVLTEQLLNFLVGFVDTFLSGRLSTAATSAIGTAAYVNWLVELFFSLIGIGTTALVARHCGALDRDAASQVASTSVSLSLGLGLVGASAVFFGAPGFGEFLDLEAESNAMLIRYLRVSAIGHMFAAVLLIGSAALRGSGNMRAPMYILGLVSVLNVLFSSVLVFGFGPVPEFGMDGIAAGTVTARFCGFVLMLMLLFGGDAGVVARPAWSAAVDFRTALRILRIGAPAAFDGFLLWSGHFVFLRVIAGLGTGAEGRAIFAAHVVGIQVEAVNYLPASAWGMAAATMIGQCLGAGRPDRAREGGNEAVMQACLMALGVALLFFFGAHGIYGIMHEDPDVARIGVPAIRLMALYEIPLSTVIVYCVGVRGAGETLRPMLINVIGIFLVRLPVAYWLGVHLQLGLIGAWGGMGVDLFLRAAAFLLYFRYGHWDQKDV